MSAHYEHLSVPEIDPPTMSVKELKAYLRTCGVSLAGVTEKSELIALAQKAKADDEKVGIKRHVPSQVEPTAPAPAPAAGGSGGDGGGVPTTGNKAGPVRARMTGFARVAPDGTHVPYSAEDNAAITRALLEFDGCDRDPAALSGEQLELSREILTPILQL